MKIKNLVLTAMLALSAGVGVGFSGNSHAVDPACRGDCGEDRQRCIASCPAGSTYQACTLACSNAYQACLAGCRL